MNAICEVIHLHLPKENKCPSSLDDVLNYFNGVDNSTVLMHSYCPNCHHLFEQNDQTLKCPICPEDQQVSKNTTYFLEYPIETEIIRRFAGIFFSF